MITYESAKYSLQNLIHRKGRSALTILSIFVGIVTIFIFISFGAGLYNYVGDLSSGSSVDKIIIQPKGIGAPGLDDTFELTDEDVKVIEGTAGMAEVTGLAFEVGEVSEQEKNLFTFIIGYDPDNLMIFEVSNIGVEEGRWLRKGDEGKVLLGYNYKVDGKIFPKALEINEKITIQGQELRIVGFLEAVGSPQDDSQIYVTLDELTSLYGTEDSYGWIIARVDDLEEIDQTIERVEKKLRNHRDLDEGKEDFYVQSFSDLIESFSSALNIVIGFVILIALISVIVSAINTANTMITSVLERYKEIGVMKAVGSTNLEIFNIFLFESSVLGLVAGVLGVAVGWALSAFAGSVLNSLGWGFLSPAFPTLLFVGCIVFATVTGAISGAIPAWKASKTNIVDALRYE